MISEGGFMLLASNKKFFTEELISEK